MKKPPQNASSKSQNGNKRSLYFEKYVNKTTRKLSNFLNYDMLVEKIASLFVPAIADWCIVVIFDDFGNIQSLKSLHKTKSKQGILNKLHNQYEIDQEAMYSQVKKVVEGRGELIREITPEILRIAARDKKHSEYLHKLGITSAMTIPLVARKKILGAAILVCSEENTSFDMKSFRLAQELGHRIATAMDNARLVMLEKHARQQTEQTMIRIHKLQQITSALSKAMTPKQVASVILQFGLKSLGANAGSVCLLEKEKKALRILKIYGYEKTLMKSWQTVPMDLHVPLVDAVKKNKTILIPNREVLEEKYPGITKKYLPQNNAFIAAPLFVKKRVIGAIACSFKEKNDFSVGDRAFLGSLVNQCTIALERALLFDAERLAKRQVEKELTIRKEAEEELRNSEERFRSLFELAPDAIYSLSKKGTFTELNPAFERITDWKRDEWIGKSYRDLVFKDDLKEAKAVFTKQEGDDSFSPHEFRIKTKTGNLIVCEFRSKTRLKNGKPVGMLGIFRDITARKQEEKERDYMIGVASHELKTPLATIKAFSQILKKRLEKDEGDHEQIKYVDRIDQHVNRLTKLIGDMLDVTRIRSGKLELREETFDFSELVRDVVSDLQAVVSSHKIVIKGDVDTYVQADKDRISRVLLNLLSNAVKYSPKADKVVLTLGSKNNEVNIRITDYGIGIPDDMKHRVFEPFSHISSKTRGSIPSVGLGLYISSQLIKSHGGKIWFDTEVGKGSTFHVVLPIKRQTRRKSV